MITRRIALLFALVSGLVFSQAPEFAQQYRQRLGGALTELNAIVTEFTADAARNNLNPQSAIAQLKNNADTLVQSRGRAMENTIVRRDALADQQQAMNAAGPLGRIFALARHYDAQVAQGAWRQFEPAIPMTPENFSVAGIGAALGYMIARILGLPFRRRARGAQANRQHA